MDNTVKFKIPQRLRKGNLKKKESEAIDSAKKDLEYIKSCIGLEDLKNTNILDVGCGAKYSQCIIQHDIQVRSYWGLDVDKKMISFLNKNVTDPVMNYRAVPFYNKMYNKEGNEMNKDSNLPIGKRKFDLIVLLSVFTHFNPSDFQSMLHILKRYLSEDGTIFFSVFLNNKMKVNFKDLFPDRPLLKAVFKQDFVEEMIDNAGLKVNMLKDKNDVFKSKEQYFLQHK